MSLGIGGSRDYSFDAGGFLDLVDLGADQVDFTFDAAGQLGQMARPAAGETLNFRYDGRGFLCDASDVVSGGYTKPTYSSQGVVMSFNRLPASGGTAEIHNVLYFAGMPMVLWSKVGAAASTRQYLTADHLGTPVFAFNTAGTAVWNGGLEPFGKDWQEGTANDMLGKGIFLRFPGQWDDAVFSNASLGTDVYYNVHRWYETQTTRYLSSDPIGLAASQNLFSYADSRPVLFDDPLGLEVGVELLLPREAPPAGCGCATDVFIKSYREMRRANWKFSDRYFHCKANCEATRCGPGGAECACLLSDLREWFDRLAGDTASDSAVDQGANQIGRSRSKTNPQTACSVNYRTFRPRSLPTQF